MSSAGHVWDAIKRMEYNRALKKMRHSRYNEMKKAVSKVDAKYHEFRDRSTLNEDQLRFLKKKIRDEIQKDKQKTFISSSLVTLAIVSLIYFIGQFLFNYFLN